VTARSLISSGLDGGGAWNDCKSPDFEADSAEVAKKSSFFAFLVLTGALKAEDLMALNTITGPLEWMRRYDSTNS
jgi:hypothetical protein